MPWKEISPEDLAVELGIDLWEIRKKHSLIDQIKNERKKQGLTQSQLAALVEVSQSRIARIEGGVGTQNMSFDLLFRILAALGFECEIKTRRLNKAA